MQNDVPRGLVRLYKLVWFMLHICFNYVSVLPQLNLTGPLKAVYGCNI